MEYEGVADEVDDVGPGGFCDLLGELFFLGFVVVELDFDEGVVCEGAVDVGDGCGGGSLPAYLDEGFEGVGAAPEFASCVGVEHCGGFCVGGFMGFGVTVARDKHPGVLVCMGTRFGVMGVWLAAFWGCFR